MASMHQDVGSTDQVPQSIPSTSETPAQANDTVLDNKAMHSKLLKTALAVIAGYNAWNMDAIMAPRAENCTHRVYPDRLGRPTLNNTAYRAYFSSLLPYFENFTVTVTGTYVDEAANRVALQAFSKANSVLGPYGNEYGRCSPDICFPKEAPFPKATQSMLYRNADIK
jgi:hypothetical protein